MPLLPRLASAWSVLFRRRRFDADLDDEVRGYLDALTARKIREGLAPAEARRAALIEMGGVDSVQERTREVRPGAAVESTLRDARYAWRGLWKSPGFAIATIVTPTTSPVGTSSTISLVCMPFLADGGRDQFATMS